MLNSRRWIFPTLILGLAVGCSRDKPVATAKVSGTVMYKGAPVPAGMIMFHSHDTKSSYQAQLRDDGHYEIVDLPPGKMSVTVDTEFINPDKKTTEYPGGGGKGNEAYAERVAAEKKMGAPIAAKGSAALYKKIPSKYANPTTSPLIVTLDDGAQVKTFELRDD